MNRTIVLGLLDIKGQELIRRVYDIKGLAPSITTCQGGQRQPKVLVRIRDEQSNKDRTNPQFV